MTADGRLPDPVALARTPTPLERLDRLSPRLDLDLWVKRDDLTGAALSGNKVRKLEFLAAAAAAEDADTLITCGAVNSNHARAAAAVAARLGMSSHLVLRGEPMAPATGNLLLDRVFGAEVTFITPEQWRERDPLMEEIAGRLRAKGRRPYVIPEGGSNALGALGYARALDELLGQAREAGIIVRRIVHATGSGGTTAGLALGVARTGLDDLDVVGVAVCDDRAYFDHKIGAILDEAVQAGYATAGVRARCRWTILEGHKGRGYGQTTPEELANLRLVARTEGLVLDPVYTNKAFRGLEAEAKAGRFEGEGATVFLHTGGIFGLFAHADDLASLDRTEAPLP